MTNPELEHQGPHAKAIISYGLMLLNLLFPILIYVFLAFYWLKHKKSQDRLLYVAINQSFISATISTLLFILANVLVLSMAQYKSTFALITFEIYFVLVVPVFLIPGLMGLVKSNASIIYFYPILGNRFKS